MALILILISMSEYLSKKISFFHLLGLIFVFLIHSPLETSNEYWDFIQSFIQNYSGVFNPLYFIIAGYLFFQSFDPTSPFGSYVKKCKKRFYTLFLPFLIGLLFCNLFLFILYHIGSQQPWVVLYNQRPIERFFLPWHLWFLRDLLIMAVISFPLYYILHNKWFGLSFIFVLLGILVVSPNSYFCAIQFGISSPLNEMIGVRFFSLFLFSIGAFLSIHKIQVEAFHKKELLFTVCSVISFSIILYGTINNTFERYYWLPEISIITFI